MIIAFTNHKGGTGKTTSVLNIGVALSKLGRKVLLVDLDPQGNLTFSLGCSGYKYTVGSMLYGKCDAADAVIKCEFVDLIPADTSIIGLNNYYAEDSEDLFEFKNCLSLISSNYDFVLLDCSPSISFLTKSALIAGDYALIPLQLEVLSIQGLEQIANEIDEIKKKYNPKLETLGVLAVMVNNSRTLTGEVLEYIKENYAVPVINNHVRASVKVAEAPSFGKSVMDYAPESTSAKDYVAVAKELLRSVRN